MDRRRTARRTVAFAATGLVATTRASATCTAAAARSGPFAPKTGRQAGPETPEAVLPDMREDRPGKPDPRGPEEAGMLLLLRGTHCGRGGGGLVSLHASLASLASLASFGPPSCPGPTRLRKPCGWPHSGRKRHLSWQRELRSLAAMHERLRMSRQPVVRHTARLCGGYVCGTLER
jgi:hypothetical protein